MYLHAPYRLSPLLPDISVWVGMSSGPPRTWQRSRLGTPLGRARLRQPFRSPLLSCRPADPAAPADPLTSPGAPPSAAGTPGPAGARSAGRPFRSPLLTSVQDCTPTSAGPLGGQRSPPETSPPTAARLAGSAASPVLRAATVVTPREDADSAAASDPAGSPAVATSSPAETSNAEPQSAKSGGAGPQSEEPGGTGRSPLEPSDAVDVERPDPELSAELAAADADIARLESAGCRAEQLPLYIAALHDYNEIKDAAQLVMGRIAELDGVTVRTVHQRYTGLPPGEQS